MSEDKRILATLLASLRLWQTHYADCEIPSKYAIYFDGIEPLTADEINTLCENINFGHLSLDLNESELTQLIKAVESYVRMEMLFKEKEENCPSYPVLQKLKAIFKGRYES